MTLEKKPYLIFKLCLLGQGGVGKTCIARRLCFDTFEMDTHLTIGIEFYTYDIPILVGNKEENIRLSIWDFGGQEQFKRMFNYYIHGANGIFMVFALDDTSSLVALDWWYEKLVEYNVHTIPRALIGAKSDLVKKSNKKLKYIVNNFQQKHTEELYFQTSSKDDINIYESFVEMTKYILNQKQFEFTDLDH